MTLFCKLGLHRAGRAARGNGGYHFTRCSRCGRDLVRKGRGLWHVPRGQRVVWQADAGPGSLSAASAGKARLDVRSNDATGAPGSDAAELALLEKQLGKILQLEVQIRHGSAGGTVSVGYASLDQLDRICQRLSGQQI